MERSKAIRYSNIKTDSAYKQHCTALNIAAKCTKDIYVMDSHSKATEAKQSWIFIPMKTHEK